jgi:hypothetical protein
MKEYLLGELSEPEQAALEVKYFTDPRIFDQVLSAENELVDNYVRGRLSPQSRERFERYYLAHPKRCERVKFAEALTTRLDQIEGSGPAAKRRAGRLSRWQRLLVALRGQRLMFGVSIAAALLVMIGGLWFFIKGRQARQELAQAQAARASQEQREGELTQRERELEQQVASEHSRAEGLAAELEHLKRTGQQAPQTAPTPTSLPAQTFVSLVLPISSVRSGDTGQPPTLVIPPGTVEARLQLKLKENDYPGYRVSLRQVGGAEILNQQGLEPRTTKSGATFTVVVPAHKFATGDYILTLRGVTKDGEITDLSKSIFHVAKG